MLLYGIVVAAIGLLCATIFRWPVMLCAAALLTIVAFGFYMATGMTFMQAMLRSAYSLIVLQTFYVFGGFLTGFVTRRLSSPKKNIEA